MQKAVRKLRVAASEHGEWTAAASAELYGIRNWGADYFDILKSDGDAGDDGRTVDASYSIVEMAYPVMQEEDEARANADLIAAAPDLYAALMALRDAAKACCADPNLLGRADMALAYARGQHGGYGED